MEFEPLVGVAPIPGAEAGSSVADVNLNDVLLKLNQLTITTDSAATTWAREVRASRLPPLTVVSGW